MPTKTKLDLVKRALQKLRIVAAGEEPSAEDAVLVGDVYASLRLELANHGVGGFEPDAIPLDAFEGLADLLAVRSAPDFGIQTSRDDLIRALQRVYATTGVPYSGEPVKAVYF